MATPHLRSGEIINLIAADEQSLTVPAHALFKDAHLEVIHMNLVAGKSFPSHHVNGPITIQCLSGDLQITVETGKKALRAGDLLYLAADVPHAVLAITNTSFLVTMVLLKTAMQ
ncbi:cupin domain-containing protein [Undibacterium sp. Di26W]|uniref:cupin domain-containing protein n=1 Tax=Undibacterium sp. Di26W TaxID=3413035 RepID=UPI003BF2E95C